MRKFDNEFKQEAVRRVFDGEPAVSVARNLYSRKVLSWRLFDDYNQKRKHQTLKMVPDEKYGIVQELKLAA